MEELINSLLNPAILKEFHPPQDWPEVNIFWGLIPSLINLFINSIGIIFYFCDPSREFGQTIYLRDPSR